MLKKTLAIIVFIYFFVRIPFDILSFLKFDNTDADIYISSKIAIGLENIKGGFSKYENEYIKVDLPFFDWTSGKNWVRNDEVSTSIYFAGVFAYSINYYGAGSKMGNFLANITYYHGFSKDDFKKFETKVNLNKCKTIKNKTSLNVKFLQCDKNLKIIFDKTDILISPYFKGLENTKLIKNFIKSVEIKKSLK